MENHKYGNSILDFTLKLLKIHEIALLMHSVTPRLPFCSALPTSKTRRERKKSLKIYCPWSFRVKPSEQNIVKSAVCNCFQQLAAVLHNLLQDENSKKVKNSEKPLKEL